MMRSRSRGHNRVFSGGRVAIDCGGLGWGYVRFRASLDMLVVESSDAVEVLE